MLQEPQDIQVIQVRQEQPQILAQQGPPVVLVILVILDLQVLPQILVQLDSLALQDLQEHLILILICRLIPDYMLLEMLPLILEYT